MLIRRRIGISKYCSEVLPVVAVVSTSCFFFAYNTSPMTPTRPPRLPPNQIPPSDPVLVLNLKLEVEAAVYDVHNGPILAPMPKPSAGFPPPPGGGGAC